MTQKESLLEDKLEQRPGGAEGHTGLLSTVVALLQANYTDDNH